MSQTFTPLTPIYHPRLDSWGLAKRTRIWMADGGYNSVDDIQEGDYVLGITFQIEQDYLPRHEDPHHEANFVKIWRPILAARKVLGVNVVEARPWQVTFGEAEKMTEDRRLIAGGETQLVTFPLSARETRTRPLVECRTSVANPRVEADFMRGEQLDPEASHAHGEPVFRPTPYSGQQRGEMIVTVPYEAYGGQMKMIRTDVRPHKRYLYKQVREVIPLKESYPLYQIKLQPDTDPETGAPVRANLIAQTPFKGGKKKRVVQADHLSRKRMTAKNWEDYMDDWDGWVKTHQGEKGRDDSPQAMDFESEMQGQFYMSQRPDMAKELQQQYGLHGGYLNGGILIEVPIDLAGGEAPEIDFHFGTQ